MKKAIVLLMIATLLFSCANVFSEEAPAQTAVDLSKTSAAILVNIETGKAVISKDSEKPVEAAGLVRLPALLAVCRAFDEGRLNPEETVTVVPEAASVRGATAFLSPNERIIAGELLKAAVMLLAGDATYALLHAAYPGEATSIQAVNAVLTPLGIGGIGESSMGAGRRFSAAELAKICTALSESAAWRKYSSIYLDTLEHENAPPTELTNPNRLVRHYSGCFGLATGSVGSSEYSGAFIAARGSTTFLAVVTGISDSASRFKIASEMLDHGFSAYRAVEIGEDAECEAELSVTGGTKPRIKLIPQGNVKALVPVTDTAVTTEKELPECVEAPIEEGAILGKLIIKNARGETLGEIPLAAAESIEKSSWKDSFIHIALNWLHVEPKA